jgi:type IV pilus assembly protein PilB
MGLFEKNQVDAALKIALSRKIRLGDYLVLEKQLTERDLARALARQYDVEYKDLTQFEPSPEAVSLLPEKVVRRFLILPLEMKGQNLTVAVHNPIDGDMLSLVSKILNMPVVFNIAAREQLIEAIDRIYQKKESTLHLIEHLTEKNDRIVQISRKETIQTLNRPGPSTTISGDGELSIEALVNRFLLQGITEKASDIHFDPTEGTCRVRMRIDGVLHEMHSYPIGLHAQVTSRIKVLSGLDIAEKRNAQDGRFQYRTLNHEADIRISTLPTIRGEKVVLRLLNKKRQNLSLQDIGMDALLARTASCCSRARREAEKRRASTRC